MSCWTVCGHCLSSCTVLNTGLKMRHKKWEILTKQSNLWKFYSLALEIGCLAPEFWIAASRSRPGRRPCNLRQKMHWNGLIKNCWTKWSPGSEWGTKLEQCFNFTVIPNETVVRVVWAFPSPISFWFILIRKFIMWELKREFRVSPMQGSDQG